MSGARDMVERVLELDTEAKRDMAGWLQDTLMEAARVAAEVLTQDELVSVLNVTVDALKGMKEAA